MRQIVSWLRGLGTAGAVTNARALLDERAWEARAVRALTRRVERQALRARRAASAA